MSMATLAKSLGMERQESMVRRLFYGPTKKFLQIDKATLLRILGIGFKDEKEFEAIVEASGVILGVVKPIQIIRLPDTLEWAEHRESDLIYRLQQGDAEYVMKEAIWSYNKIKYDERLPQEDKETIKWLLRYGKIIEQAQETSLTWHGDRARQGLVTLKRLEDDIADRYGWQEKFYFESVRLLFRKAMLWRETYRDDHSKNERNLQASTRYFDDAVALLSTSVKDSIFKVVLLCQRLHVLAIVGDERWVQEINTLDQSIDGNPHLTRAQKVESRTIINFFRSVGYKRFAWALRNYTDRASVKKRNFCIKQAHIYFQEFNSSEYRMSVWRAAHMYSGDLTGIGRASEEQAILLSDKQSALLLSISEIETDVWFKPEDILVDSFSAIPLAQQFYPSAIVKIMNTQRFARSLIERG